MIWIWIAAYLFLGFVLASTAVVMSKRASATDSLIFSIVVILWLPLLIIATFSSALNAWVKFLGRFS